MSQHGFTLVEMMVVVVILALLATLATPVLSRDNEEERFNRFTSVLVQDLLAAHHRAISSKDDYRLMIRGEKYQIESVVVSTNTASLVVERRAPLGVVVADVRAISAMPWDTGHPTPADTDLLATEKQLRFSGLGNMAVDVGGGPSDTTATIFVRTENGKLKARVVVFAATSKPHLIAGW